MVEHRVRVRRRAPARPALEPPTLLDLLIVAYPVPDPCRSQEQAERFYHRDVDGLDRATRARELAIVRLLVLLGGPAWFEVREAALLRGSA